MRNVEVAKIEGIRPNNILKISIILQQIR